ncbi:MAG: glycosyltransferase family 1 protein [Magnetococcales bacterium]|nr:glycosyltransferase family 1 protein [Magnetococcales bacterium]
MISPTVRREQELREVLERNFRKNMQLLRYTQPELHQRLLSHPRPAAEELRVVEEGGRLVNVSVQLSHGRWVLLHDPDTQYVVGARILQSIERDSVTVLAGLGLGYELLTLFERTRGGELQDFDRIVPLYAVETESEDFVKLLHLRDLGDIITSGRIRFFVGGDAFARFEEFLDLCVDSETDRPLPVRFVNSHDRPEGIAPFQEAVNRRIEELNARSRGLLATLNHYYDTEWESDLLGFFRGLGSRKPRILGLTTRFSSFLQFCVRDLLEGFAELGCETCCLIESDRDRTVTIHHMLRTMERFRPDLMVILDHFRHEQHGGIPAGLPVVTWIQDLLPNVRDGEGEVLGPRDFVFSFSKKWIRAGYFSVPLYRGRTVRFLPMGFNAGIYRPLEGVEREIDVLYVSHLTNYRNSLYPLREGDESLSLTAGEQALVENGHCSTNELLHILKRMVPFLDVMRLDDIYAMVLELQLGGEHRILNTFTDAVLEGAGVVRGEELLNTLFFSLDARWVYDLEIGRKIRCLQRLTEEGLDVHVYGFEWERVSSLRKVARGVVRSGADLNLLSNRARICLHITGTTLHMRAMEILGSGSFFICKRLHPLGDNTPILDYFVEGEEIALFDDEADLVRKVRHYLTHEEERETIARRGHEKAKRLFAYPRIAERILEDVAGEL